MTKRFPTVDPQRLETIESALRKVFADSKPDRRVDVAVAVILRSDGRASIDSVASAAGVSSARRKRTTRANVLGDMPA